MRQIHGKVFGTSAAISRVIKQADGVVGPDVVFTGNISLGYRAPEVWRERLLFPIGSTEAQDDLACAKFITLLRDRCVDPQGSLLNGEEVAVSEALVDGLPPEIPAHAARYPVNMVLYWDGQMARFRVADPAATSRTGKLVAWPLGSVRWLT